MKQNNILDTIIAHKSQEISAAKKETPIAAMHTEIESLPQTRGFKSVLFNLIHAKQIAIISEIKHASPSKGILSTKFNPQELATQYAQAGAACLSVLTDEKFFLGHWTHIKQVKEIVSLPILRKDFIIDAYQIYQSRLMGADAILLIAAILDKKTLLEYSTLASQLGLDTLLEVHTEEELGIALSIENCIIGINNRNLATFATDINTTLNLLPRIPHNRLLVTESGIHNHQQIQQLTAQGVYGFLIGESLVKADNASTKLTQLLKKEHLI